MANSWLRLWHDMPNDPKWRTISRISGQPISLVQATYIHLLVSASRNVTRGHAHVTTEDLASALDVTEEQISSVLMAMQGRVLDGDYLTGWERRQVKKEDSGNPESRAMSASERKRKQRERERQRQEGEHKNPSAMRCHDESRNVTTDKDTDTEEELKDQNTLSDFGSNRTADEKPASPEKPPAPENPEPEQTAVRGSGDSPDPDQGIEPAGDSDPPDKPDGRDKPGGPDPVDQAFGDIFWKAGLCKVGKVKACSAFRSKYRAWKKSTHGSPPEFASMLASDIRQRLSSGVFGMDKLHPATYLNQERWNDEKPQVAPAPSGGTNTVGGAGGSWYTQSNDGSAEVFINQAAIDRLKRGANRP
ncbi:phage replisome organizer [Salmonella enterica]|nr:phage replisome organizer [Salmonella enterica]